MKKLLRGGIGLAAGLLAGGLAVGLQFGDSALVCGAEKTAANTAASSEAGKLDTALTTAQLEKPIDKLPTMEAPTPIGVKPGDWSMWGGTTTRNNTPKGVDICTEWEVGSFDSKTGEWKRDKSENIKWVSRLGSQSYGNPVVANGQIYVGSNNGAGYLKRYPAAIDLGVLLAFNEADGKFLWQHSNEKLPTGRVHDWPLQGVCASAYGEGDRVWYVTNRGEVVCLDAKGFYDGVDNGPVTKQPAKLFELAKNEDPKKDKFAAAVATLKEGKLPPDVAALCETAGLAVPAGIALVAEKTAFKGSFKPKDATVEREVLFRIEGPRLVGYKILNVDDKDEADVIWQLNMMHDLGISQHNMCACSVTAVGDLLFVNTSNGVDEGHVNLPAPKAPSFVALDKNTGKVIWTDNSPGTNVLHGQWSSPTYAVIDKTPQVLFGGGDGWLYAFEGTAANDEGHAKHLWKFDCNPKESKYVLGGRADRNHIIGTPVFYKGLAYVGVGEDPEHGEGVGHLWCIDPRKRGDVSSELAFSLKDLQHPLPPRRNQAVIKEQGEVARPNPNSAAVWHYANFDRDKNGKIDFEETFHRTCGTVSIKDDLLYVADFSGLLHCLNALTGEAYWTYDMLAACWGSPLIVEDKVYVGDEDGDIVVFKLSKEMEKIGEEHNMGSSVYSTPVVANNVLFIADKDHLFAITPGGK
jgi:outer membrane protein assembly factor BamB